MVNSVVLKNASIIDGSGSAPYSGHLVIKENKIDSIHQEDAFSHDIEASIIDLKGNTVMPGLIDAHCHISFDEPRSNLTTSPWIQFNPGVSSSSYPLVANSCMPAQIP